MKDWCGSRTSSCDFEDFVMVPAHFSSKNPVLSGFLSGRRRSTSLLLFQLLT